MCRLTNPRSTRRLHWSVRFRGWRFIAGGARVMVVRHRMFARSNIFLLMFRIANLLAASFFVLCVIVPDSWCYGPSDPNPRPPNPHGPATLREIISAVVIFIWFASALGLFSRSRLCWFGSLAGVGMMIVFFAGVLVSIFRECFFSDARVLHERQQLIGGFASEVFLDLLVFGFLGICLALSVGLFLGLLKMRRDLR